MSHAMALAAIALFAVLNLITGPAMAVGTDDGSSDSASAGDYDQAKAAVDAGDFAAALPILTAITKAEPQNADAWNLLGFTHRMLGHNDESAQAYLVVLDINPNHLGALEYQGELFINTGKMDLAKANLAKLQSLCGTCEEYEDLDKALKAAGA